MAVIDPDSAVAEKRVHTTSAFQHHLQRSLAASVFINGLLVIVCTGLVIQGGTVAWALLFAFPASFILAFSNGGNDCANSVGTAVGAGAISIRRALFADAFVEALGAISIRRGVVGTIAGAEIHAEKFDKDPDIFALAMLSVIIAAGFTTLLATLYGYPISATHGVISGIVAVGLASGVDGAINWGGVGFTVFGWIASPLAGALGGFVVSLIVHKMVIGAADPVEAARSRHPILLMGTLFISFLFLLIKGPPVISIWINARYWIALLLAVAGSATASLLVYKFQYIKFDGSGFVEQVSTVDSPMSTSFEIDGSKDSGGDESPSLEPETETCTTLNTDENMSSEEAATQQPFGSLLIAAGLTVAFAHGGNDIGNAVAPLAIIIGIAKSGSIEPSHELPLAYVLLVTVAFSSGIIALGSRTISTVGSKITHLIPSRSFASQVGAAVAVLGSSMFGLPVSTSHCLVGSMVGVSLSEKYCGVQGPELDLRVLCKIVIGWAVTIPLAALISVLA
eukprot:CAMPEP_0171925118 /NCGR_PEP_ID=MMETSP0993-20121228/23638_1 /TAXON_ID=483369 /ORGANISM="non described non described, Strain CCMP2098" /LENGTH=508 /DNA_ID=CAMNT_0012563593 /DNA_START=91 /DNA_END=1613 /DNA_ORIENTATION=-